MQNVTSYICRIESFDEQKIETETRELDTYVSVLMYFLDPEKNEPIKTDVIQK